MTPIAPKRALVPRGLSAFALLVLAMGGALLWQAGADGGALGAGA